MPTTSSPGRESLPADGTGDRSDGHFDRWGIPHIAASSAHDLFFAQGFIVARDRLFQLDLWRGAV